LYPKLGRKGKNGTGKSKGKVSSRLKDLGQAREQGLVQLTWEKRGSGKRNIGVREKGLDQGSVL